MYAHLLRNALTVLEIVSQEILCLQVRGGLNLYNPTADNFMHFSYDSGY